jgi:purine nucleosidase/pyrimidine-specific ribonucleoside hydrolase
MPTPVIIDCDPGHDDVFAIWLAAGNPALDLLAITTVSGNGFLEHTTHNARIACTVAGIVGVPIASGADRPLVREVKTAPHIHGDNALGGPVLPEPTVPIDERSAVQLIADTLDASEVPVTLLPTGPLTNIARFVQEFPDKLAKVEKIVWMGGSTARGNRVPYAEFNSWADPEAVDIVLKSGIPFTMVGLNITHQALITSDVIARIGAIGNETSSFGVELLEFFCSTYRESYKMADGPLHDPVAVALVADPTVVDTVFSRLDIELAGTETAGATSVDLLDQLHREPNATIAMTLHVDAFWDLIVDAISTLR